MPSQIDSLPTPWRFFDKFWIGYERDKLYVIIGPYLPSFLYSLDFSKIVLLLLSGWDHGLRAWHPRAAFKVHLHRQDWRRSVDNFGVWSSHGSRQIQRAAVKGKFLSRHLLMGKCCLVDGIYLMKFLSSTYRIYIKNSMVPKHLSIT